MREKKFDGFIWLRTTPRVLELWRRGLLSPRAFRNILAKNLGVKYSEKRFPYGQSFKLPVPKEIEEKYNSLDLSQKEALASVIEQDLFLLLEETLNLKLNEE